MPVEALVDHPQFIALPAAGRGILLSLLLHFWTTELAPLPKSDRELRSIGRAHVPTWKHWGPSVLKVFAEVAPALESYYRLRQVRGTTLSVMAQMRGSRAKVKALRAAATPNQTVQAYSMGAIPKSDPRLPTKRKQTPQGSRLQDRPQTT